jgi:hypothetical protein
MAVTHRRGLLRLASLLLLVALPSVAAAQGQGDGAALHAALVRMDVLDDYLVDLTRAVIGDLVRVSRRWTSVQINGRYDPGGINVYLIDAGKLPAGRPLADFGLSNPEGNATALETARIVVVDTAFLKALVATATLMAARSLDTTQAVATVRAQGLDAFADLWDPARNPALLSAGPTQKWRLLYTGALAFVLGHELGHIALGPREAAPRAQPRPFTGRDRDTYRACPSLIDPAHRARQSVEAEADTIAAELLGALPGQLTPQQPRRFVYELGAQWYFVYSMAQGLLSTLFVTESRFIHAYVKASLGPALYDAVLLTGRREDVGSVHVFFPFGHPPDYRRAAQSVGRLRSSPYSYFYGEPHPAEQQMLEQVRERACVEVAADRSSR